jgi:hypothetical protein
MELRLQFRDLRLLATQLGVEQLGLTWIAAMLWLLMLSCRTLSRFMVVMRGTLWKCFIAVVILIKVAGFSSIPSGDRAICGRMASDVEPQRRA